MPKSIFLPLRAGESRLTKQIPMFFLNSYETTAVNNKHFIIGIQLIIWDKIYSRIVIKQI